MIKEDYVSFETSKLLKEKWFDQNCATYYLDGQVWRHYHGEVIPKDKQIYAAPTQAMVMKWLREVHNIHIVIHPYTDIEGHNWSFILDKFAYDCWQELGIYITDSWNTYEETCEAAIKYTLENLI